jgi:hypothetical protein
MKYVIHFASFRWEPQCRQIREYLEAYCSTRAVIRVSRVSRRLIKGLSFTLRPTTCARFLWISDQRMLSRQSGVYRVNCIDCLDRTNVVQASGISLITSTYELINDAVCIRSARPKPAVARARSIEPFRSHTHRNGCCL